MNGTQQTYYELLDISPSASSEEIQQAYRAAKDTYSPESPALYSMFSKEEAMQINLLIDEAYKTLSHHARRREYDQNLREGHFEVFQDKTMQPQSSQEKPSLKYTPINDDTKESCAKQGIGITRFGKYTLNPVFEDEIKNQEIFDGTFLKKIREYKRVELDLISEHLKISKHHFIAIENNDFDSLPVIVFVKNYIKQYAEVLELDAKKVSDSYIRILKEVREEK